MIQALPRYQPAKPRAVEPWVEPLRENFSDLGSDALKPAPIPGVPDTLEEWFARSKIVSGLKTIRFDPYAYQWALCKILEEGSTAWLKTRQLGLTQIVLTVLLYEAARYGYTSLWISAKGEDGGEVIRRCRKIISGMPGLSSYLANNNLTSLEFKDGNGNPGWGRIVTRAPVADCGRGLSNVRTIVFDEAQSIPEMETVYGAALPTSEAVGEDARVIVLGTPPKSPQGYYWEILQKGNPSDIDLLQVCDRVSKKEAEPYQAWKDSSGWTKVVCHWAAHPKHAHKSVDEYLGEVRQRTNLPEGQLQREYGLRIPSMDEVSVFSVASIKQCTVNGTFAAPQKHGIYATGIDPSAASGRDYTVVCTVQLIPHTGKVHVVALWRQSTGAISSHVAAAISQVQSYPGAAWVEINGVGAQWPEQLGAALPSEQVIPHHTSQAKKETLYGRLGLALEGDFIRMDEGVLTEELQNLQYKPKGKIEAAGDGHDDAADALALAIAALEWNPYTTVAGVPRDDDDW